MAFNRTLVAAVVGMAGLAGSAHAQYAHLILHSEPGDYVGQGQDWNEVYTPQNSTFFNAAQRGLLPDGSLGEVVFSFSHTDFSVNDGDYALLFFGTNQLGIPLQAGTYLDAQRADFAAPGHPGLDVSFAGRGCNTVTGSFTITDVSYTFDQATGQYKILKFDADFIQHCEGGSATLTGTFSYNAVPEPASTAALGLGALGLIARRRRRSSKSVSS